MNGAYSQEQMKRDMGRMIGVVHHLLDRIRLLERSLHLLLIALTLMTACNLVIILRVFFMEAP